MSMKRRSAKWMSLTCALTLVAACQAPSTVKPTFDRNQTVSSNAFGNVTISVNGRTFTLKADDDKPLTKVAVQAAGDTWDVENGQLALPASALQRAKTHGRGYFAVLAQGYSPRQVWIGQEETEIRLSKIEPLTIIPQLVNGTKATIISPKRDVAVTFPASAFNRPTNVAMSEYVPPEPTSEQKAKALEDRASLLDKMKAKTAALKGGNVVSPGAGNVVSPGAGNVVSPGAGNFRIASADCDPPGPIPCEIVNGIGMLLTVDGQLNPGAIQVTYDLAEMLPPDDASYFRGLFGLVDDLAGALTGLLPYRVQGGPPSWVPGPPPWHNDPSIPPGQLKKMKTAGSLLSTFADLDADPDYRDGWRAVLEEEYGLKVQGTRVSFPVEIDSSALADGYTTSTVWGFLALGAVLEVTIIASQDATGLPAIANLPDMVALNPANALNLRGTNAISNNAANLIANNSAGLISNNSAGLISNNAGNLIANNGGGLFGSVRVPFRPDAAKYNLGKAFGLLAIQEHDWPSGAKVRAVSETGQPLTDWAMLDDDGVYRLDGVPSLGGVIFLECEASLYNLRTLAPVPAVGSFQRADLSTVSTTVTSLVRESVNSGVFGVEDVNPYGGYNQDQSVVANAITQQQAEQVVAVDLPAVAQIAQTMLGSQPASVNTPVLNWISVKFEEFPDHPSSAKGLAAVTGVRESDIKKGKEIALTRGYTFANGVLTVNNQGYGRALNNYSLALVEEQNQLAPDEGGGGDLPASGSTGTTDGGSTFGSLTEWLTGNKVPKGPVRLLYTAEIQRGSGDKVRYQFRQAVSNYALLEANGNPLEMQANMLLYNRVPGALLGNYWAFVGESR